MILGLNHNRFEKACQLQKQGELKQALTLFEFIFKLSGSDFDLLLHLGECHSKLNQLDRAHSYFLKATDLFPESEYASKSLFFTLWGLERRDEAVLEIKRYYPFGFPREYQEIIALINKKEF